MHKQWIIAGSSLLMVLALGVVLGRWTAPPPAEAATPTAAAPSAITTAPPVTREITASNFTVVRVIDGDTFKVEYDGDLTSVRMLYINAPERGDPRADAATDELRRLIDGQIIQLHFDAARRRDNFGRLLCRVTVDGLDIGQHLLDAGLVSVYQPGPRRTNTTP